MCIVTMVVVVAMVTLITGLRQQTIIWDMVVGKLIIIPALGHQNKGKSSFTGSGLFVLMSQCGNNNELAHHHVPCDRLLQKAYYSSTLASNEGGISGVIKTCLSE